MVSAALAAGIALNDKDAIALAAKILHNLRINESNLIFTCSSYIVLMFQKFTRDGASVN
tara:strand:- start:219 stop:395 length:177 start_codon:yes stop_codon:yes gene_type:complete